MLEPDDRLLYVLSARRTLEWAAFKKAYDALYAPTGAASFTNDDRKWLYARTAHALDALGHCDVRFDEWNGRVSVGPAILSRLPVRGLPEAVLLGARSPSTVTQLERVCTSYPRPVSIVCADEEAVLPLLPTRISLQAESVDDLAAIARSLRVKFASESPSWTLAHFAGSLNAYVGRLRPSSLPEPEVSREDFDLRDLRFHAATHTSAAVRLSRYSEPDRSVQRYMFWSASDSHAPIDRDWGRYAVFQANGVHVLIYDDRRASMAVPLGAALPRLFARVLTLCSGYAPSILPVRALPGVEREGKGYTVYRDVPEQVALLVAEKLSQRPIKRSIPDMP